MAKRQTVWLSAMMILSLMVIGYYTVDGTLAPVPTSLSSDGKLMQPQAQGSGAQNSKPQDQTQGTQNNKATDAKQPDNAKAPDAKASDGKTQQQGQSGDSHQTMTGGDWFAQRFIDRETAYSQKVEQLQQVIADSKTSTDAKIKAEQDLKSLTEFAQKAEQAENRVMEQGFPEALITKDNDRITVTVQTNDLTKEQVAKIYGIVSKELNVPASQIVVSYKP
ncbi:SpoIIIAH-like family protein [Effusibacillus dendaii]|uniref:Stage III sporulation protein AH n=1 Tax=Effusibacillus dendaii TaxID=2743772 RepID=A0A7I8D6Y6_9BACL|nr:SpoIIIAH-like family protein [Effusibacillus dendaii]BCJ85923.1 stage III sporulation protein AH [Effusibacillus dendaii]